MELLNLNKLPEPFRTAIENDDYDAGINVVASATTLIKPVRVTKLRKEYFQDLKENAVRRVSALLGTAVHSILEKHGEDLGWIVEQRFYGISKSELTFSGQLDALIPNEDGTHSIRDYKVVPTFKHNDFGEYKDQLNIQAVLATQAGYEIKDLKIVAVFKDWMESRTGDPEKYPDLPIMEYSVPLKPYDEMMDWIDTRLKQISGDEIPECTDEERWIRESKWAVYKPKGKRAVRVFTDGAEAEAFNKKELGGKGTIEHRRATPVRCAQNYCGVAEFCSQWKEEEHLWKI